MGPAGVGLGVHPVETGGRFLPGTLVGGRYRMIGLLGRGGMGEVYRADDLKLGQPVALKFLPLDVESDPNRLERFLNEVRTSLRVTHPNVCRVFDVGQIDRRHFLSMEYVDGEDLGSLLRRIGRLPEDKAIEIARQLCAGLAAAHDEGVLHRDIKPANIMIDGRGRAKITDFGLAGAAAGIEGVEARVGTPQYMAPEQIDGGALSERTDLYALGLVLYELFTGKRAFDVLTVDDLRQARSTTPASPASHVVGLNPLVERAILRCLAPDPVDRPASVSALAAALPGGDPLAMAIAAGDTPSPEMVAAAGAEVGISANRASVLLVVALVGMVVLALLAGKIAIFTIGAPVKAPAVMIERARELLTASGARGTVADSAWGLAWNEPYLNSSRANEAQDPDGMAKYGVTFWYREGSVLLGRWVFIPPYSLTAIWHFDPPLAYSGDTLVMLDREGRLLQLTVLAPERPADAPAGGDVNWDVLFRAAGLEPATWAPAEPQWVPAYYADWRSAWTPRASQPVPATRVEAASFRGRPTSFSVIYPWTTPVRDAGTWRSAEKRIGDLLGVSLLGGLMLGAVIMARRNLRLDRADRAGALRVGMVVGGLVWLAWLCDEHHIAAVWELYLVMAGTGLALFNAAFAATFYLALEPHVRRRWPSILVSWSRLIAGDVFDPLVARDVLIGAAVMAVAYLARPVGHAAGPARDRRSPAARFVASSLHGRSAHRFGSGGRRRVGHRPRDPVPPPVLHRAPRRALRVGRGDRRRDAHQPGRRRDWQRRCARPFAVRVRVLGGHARRPGACGPGCHHRVIPAAVPADPVSGHVATDRVVIDDRCDWPHALAGGGLHRVPDRHSGAGASDPQPESPRVELRIPTQFSSR